MFDYPIAIGLSPNTEDDDVLTALKIILKPWKWVRGEALFKVHDYFRNYFNNNNLFFFNSGRSALDAILKAGNIGSGDEVIIQAFTCIAVPEPVLWNGAIPIYADIDESLNINPSLLEKYITKKTKAIIVQHTFGICADLQMIKKIAQKHNLLLIEDCAHSLGGQSGRKKMGTFGDFSFFSFGRDKIISSVFGGMAMIGENPALVKRMKDYYSKLEYPSKYWIFKQMMHPVFFSLILPFYNLFIGKFLLFILLGLKLIDKPVADKEKKGIKPEIFPRKYPNAMAVILLNQLKKLKKFNKKRFEIASYYYEKLKNSTNLKLTKIKKGNVYLRYNIHVKNSDKVIKIAKDKKVLLGNWYKNVIDPKGTDLGLMGYKLKSCPNAEAVASKSLNLPTYPRLKIKDLDKVIEILKFYAN